MVPNMFKIFSAILKERVGDIMETNQNGNIKKEKIPPHPNIKYKENYQKFKVLIKKRENIHRCPPK